MCNKIRLGALMKNVVIYMEKKFLDQVISGAKNEFMSYHKARWIDIVLFFHQNIFLNHFTIGLSRLKENDSKVRNDVNSCMREARKKVI
jgi:hypothetical protein